MKKRKERSGKTKEQLALKEPATKPLLRKRVGKTLKTQHRRAMKKPTVRQLVGRLKRYWDRWDEIKRGELLQILTDKDHQCSVRGLANDLDKKETTLRRCIMLSQLPPEERKKFSEGETIRLLMARKIARDRERAIADRIAEERRSGALSDEVSEIILDFCLARREPPIVEGGITSFLNKVREVTRGLSVTSPVKIKLPKNISLAHLYGLARPEDRPGEFWLEHRAGWLANILVTIAPELVIRERAINKAEERVHKNLKKQVEIRPDLEAVWQNRLKSLLAICAPNPQ